MAFRTHHVKIERYPTRWRDGTIAVTFALLMLPMIGLVGLAIDYGFQQVAKERIDVAADAAVLEAATTAAQAFSAYAPNYNALGSTAGTSWFNAQASVDANITKLSPQLTVTNTGGVFTASMTYQAAVTTSFANIFGYSTFPISGKAIATITVGGYADIHILMDDSSSMSIAATQDAMTHLGTVVANSPLKSWDQNQNCAFGCHFDAGGNDFYGLARANNIPLRIDVLNQAVSHVITTLSKQNVLSLYRIGLYTFNKTFTTIFPLSGDINAALAAQKAVQVPVADPNNEPDTDFPLAMQSMTTLIPTSGNGATAQTPQKFLFLVTDGVQDYTSGGSRILGLMNPSNCSALKANGITILVLYTTYIPIPTNAFYNANVAPISANITPYLTSCASSPNYFFTATDAAGIQAALQQMLQIATSTQGRFVQ